MASNTASSIYCAVCKEKMNRYEKEPVCLPSCGHSFCRECLIGINDAVGRITCPTCRICHQGQLPQDLPVNWLLLEMLDKEEGESTRNQDSTELPVRNTREAPQSTNHISVDFNESCKSNKDKESSSNENQNSNTIGRSSKFWKTAGIAAGSVIGGLGLVAAAPLALTAVGFTSTGIAASSFAASMMSSAAIANGGGVAAGSLATNCQVLACNATLHDPCGHDECRSHAPCATLFNESIVWHPEACTICYDLVGQLVDGASGVREVALATLKAWVGGFGKNAAKGQPYMLDKKLAIQIFPAGKSTGYVDPLSAAPVIAAIQQDLQQSLGLVAAQEPVPDVAGLDLNLEPMAVVSEDLLVEVAVLQSAGAAGIGATATGAVGAAGAGIGGGTAFVISKLFGRASSDDSSNCNESDSMSKKNDDGEDSKSKKNEDFKDPYEEAASFKKKLAEDCEASYGKDKDDEDDSELSD